MTRRDAQRLTDILDACDAIDRYLARGDLSDGLIFDAVRMRLVEIGEAVKALSVETLARDPSFPWRRVAGMRDRLAHQYFDTEHAVVAHTVVVDLPTLKAVVESLLAADAS